MNRHSRGVTLVELMVAVAIAAVVITTAMYAYTNFMKGSIQQQRNSLFQQEMATAAQIVEGDIRMSGYGLPGTGLRISMNVSTVDSVHLYNNEDNLQTTLLYQASPGAPGIRVLDASGVSVGQYVCIDNDSCIIYRRILQIVDITGGKAIGFDASLPASPYLAEVAETDVYYCNRISYFVDPTDGLIRTKDSQTNKLSALVTSLTAEGKDADDVTVSDYDDARTLTFIFTGGGGDHEAKQRSDTLSALIRNYQ